MSFGQAIASAFANYFNFSGRASFRAYWFFVLFEILVSIVLAIPDYLLFPTLKIGPLGGAFSLVTLIPGISLSIRRLHDTGRSGWWFLLIFIPIIGWLVLLYWALAPSQPPNEYGTVPP